VIRSNYERGRQVCPWRYLHAGVSGPVAGGLRHRGARPDDPDRAEFRMPLDSRIAPDLRPRKHVTDRLRVPLPAARRASAIWCNDVEPARRISRMTGSTLAA
jgi:hypothetical protein